MGKPERRRSTRRASIGVLKAYERKAGSVETSPRVPEVPARITRSRALEFVSASQGSEDLECDQKEKGKESCVVESNIRSLRSRVLVVGGNKGRLRGNPKQGRSRRNAGKQEEDNEDACLNLKLGEGEVSEKKNSRKRSRVAEAPPCEEPRLRRSKRIDNGNMRSETTEVDDRADDKVSHCGGLPARRPKCNLLKPETVVFDAGMVKEVEALPKRSRLSTIKYNVTENVICSIAKGKSGDECETVGRHKRTKRTSKQDMKSKAPVVSEAACEFTTESATSEVHGEPAELPEFRVSSQRLTQSFSKHNKSELVSLPTSGQLIDKNLTTRTTRSRKQQRKRGSSEGHPPTGETESTHGALEVQGESKIVVQCEELPLHLNQNTWKTGTVECEATEGFKAQPQQTDEVTKGTGSIASPSANSESEALAIPKQKIVPKRSTGHKAKNTKNEACTTSVLQAVSDEIGKKKETTTKRPREAVLDDDVTYAESEACGGFPHMRNPENDILIDGDDKKPKSHVTTARTGMNCRKVNSLDEALQSECSPDLPLRLLEDSYQDTLAGKCLIRNVSRKNQTSQSLQSIGKMSMNKQKNFGFNADEKIGDDNLFEAHKCLGDQVSLVHENQAIVSGSSEVMDLCEALEASPCFAVQGSCTKNEDEEKISEARHPVLVDTLHAALSTYTDELSGSSETVNEVVRNPRMDNLAFEQTTIAFAVDSVSVENVEQVDTTEVGHKVIDTVSTPVTVADHCGLVADAIHNEEDSELKELSSSVGGVSLTCKEIGKFTAAAGTEVSAGIDQEELVMVANVLNSTEITSHLPGSSNDTHKDSSDLHSAPSKDVGMVEAAPTSILVSQLATEIFGDAEEIKEEDKDSTDSCPRILVLEEHEETMMPENISPSVVFKEDVAEGIGDQMKQSLLIDRLVSDHFPSMSPQKTAKSLSCLEISHDGSSSHNNVVAIRPEVGIFENMETSASEHAEAQTVGKETNLEMLDDVDARKHSEMGGDSNVSLEERFCEDSISLLAPTFVMLLNKQDEDLEMAAKDVELPLKDNVACEVEHKSEKASCLNTRVDAEGEDRATSESQLQMDQKHATLLRFDSNKIYSKSGIQEIMLEDVGMDPPARGKIEDVSETNADSCCEDSERDNKGTKLSSIDLVTRSCIFGEEASAVTVAEDFQQSDFEEPSFQMDIHGDDAMNLHQNWHSTVVSIDIPEPEIQSSSYLQNDLENKTEALSVFIGDNATAFVDDSRTCKTSPGNLENCTTDCLPVDLEKAGVDGVDCHHDDEKVAQVRNSTVTDNLDIELCPAGLMQQHIDEEPAEDNLKVVFDSIDACLSIKQQNPIIYNLAVGGVSEELENSNVNTTVGVDINQISAFPCKFHEGQECVSPSAVNDQKPVEEAKTCEFKSLVMNADEITKHIFAAASDDMNKESMGLSINDVIGHEDGNETIAGLEENADRYDNNNGEAQNFDMCSESATSEVSADGVKIVARQSNNENQDSIKSESMVRFDSDDTEGAQVDNGEAWADTNEINLILNNCEIFMDSEDANGCKGENSPAAYMVEEEGCSLDITKSEGTLAESELGEGPSSVRRLVSVSREQFPVNCTDAWNVDVVDEAVSGKQDQEELNSIENEACNSTRQAAVLKHEVEGITYAGIPDLNDHEGSSRSKYLESLSVNIKGMENEETNICGIQDCLHEMENTCLEDSKIEENNHETECEVMAAVDNEIGKWIDAGFPPASEISDKQAPSPESQHHLGKENLFGSAYSKITDDLGSQGELVGVEMFSATECKEQDGGEHKLIHETSVVVASKSDETEFNSNSGSMTKSDYRKEETTVTLIQSTITEETVSVSGISCAEIVGQFVSADSDQVEESKHEENPLGFLDNCSPKVDEAVSGKQDQEEINSIEHEACNSTRKAAVLKHEVVGITYAGIPDLNDQEGSSRSKYLESLNVNIKGMENEETNICGIQDCLQEMENTCLEDSKIEENNHVTECQVMATADNEIGKWIDAGSPPAGEISEKQAPSPESQHHLGKENLFGSAYFKSTEDLGSRALDLYHDKRKSFQEANFLKANTEKAPENFCSPEPGELVGVEMFSATECKEEDGGEHKLIHETSVVVASKSDETEFNSNSGSMTKSDYRMEETTVTLIQSTITEETVSVSGISCAEIVGQFVSADSDQVEESKHEENPLGFLDNCSPKISNHMKTDASWIESIRGSELHMLDEINHKLINFNISSTNKFKKKQIHGAPTQLVDALRPKIQITELQKENPPIIKGEHTIKCTAEKPRRPLQGLQNNELVRQK
ncbi:hypothetical protein J5N97_021258 [Dioscorea zingiberensis]|uniref:Uncharacterized protein n=1 Tax=Dioscorea zingiberensis TaxID=325984 RepID=A0A9D5CHX2_9LILI|nr:hypothetical protein J5N97_021258 [Dioscorea zingiberensis]